LRFPACKIGKICSFGNFLELTSATAAAKNECGARDPALEVAFQSSTRAATEQTFVYPGLSSNERPLLGLWAGVSDDAPAKIIVRIRSR
jgi:hypothetical protein